MVQFRSSEKKTISLPFKHFFPVFSFEDNCPQWCWRVKATEKKLKNT